MGIKEILASLDGVEMQIQIIRKQVLEHSTLLIREQKKTGIKPVTVQLKKNKQFPN